jgi:hypothetical protein
MFLFNYDVQYVAQIIREERITKFDLLNAFIMWGLKFSQPVMATKRAISQDAAPCILVEIYLHGTY